MKIHLPFQHQQEAVPFYILFLAKDMKTSENTLRLHAKTREKTR